MLVLLNIFLYLYVIINQRFIAIYLDCIYTLMYTVRNHLGYGLF